LCCLVGWALYSANPGFKVQLPEGFESQILTAGFLTEAREARMLASDPYQEKLAAALADGIKAFLDNQ